MTEHQTKSGYVSIVGKPNVGKSTLLNHYLGTKLSITSRKPQTTRHQLLGVLTRGASQVQFIDTPGVHRLSQESNRAMNRYMNRQAIATMKDVDAVLFMIDGKAWTADDDNVLKYLQGSIVPVICVINKVDRVVDKRRLLPLMELVSGKAKFDSIVPISALQSEGLDELFEEIQRLLPYGPHLFAGDDLTDRPTAFFVAELIREQLVRQLGEELPHRTSVQLETYSQDSKGVAIRAIIFVERDSQKGIVIGKHGQRLRSIGQAARNSIRKFLDQPTVLRLLVRVKKDWTNNQDSLVFLGYK